MQQNPALNTIKFTMLNVQPKVIRHSKKQENMTHKRENNQSLKQSQKWQICRQSLKYVFISLINMLKDIKGKHEYGENERRNQTKTQIELLEKKNTYGINRTLDTIGGKMSKLKKDSNGNYSNETQREAKPEKINRAPASCRMLSHWFLF